MRKTLIAAATAVLVLGACPFASAGIQRNGYDRMPENYLNLSFFISPSNIGLMHRITGGLYGVGGLRYDGDRSELFFQAGAAYQIPRKILFFRLYGGGGLEYSRNRMTLKPYALVGTRFWIFLVDMTYPLERDGEPVSRFGFSFSF